MTPATELAGLRVAFLAGTLGQGGAEQQLFYILRALCEAGASPRLLTLTRGEFWEEPLRALGVPVTWVGRSPGRPARLLSIVRDLRREPAPLVQSQHFYTNLYAAFAARLTGAQEIGAVRNDVSSEVDSNGRLLGSMSLRMPRILAVNSKAAMLRAAEYGIPPARLQLLPNVVDTERFCPAPRESFLGVRIVTVGRMVAAKRHDRLLDILVEVRRRTGQAVEGVIAGDGPLRGQTEAKAQGLGLLPGGLRFTGRVDSALSVYREAEIFALTSDHEGTPNVVLEAMACGLPVVATRVGELPNLIEHGVNGFLVDKERPDQMSEILACLVASPAKRHEIGSAARRSIEERYSRHALPRILAAFYRAVAGSLTSWAK